MVTLIGPEDPEIGDPIGAERPFTTLCDQLAALTMYLDDEPVHQSDLGVQKVFHTFESAPPGEHMVRVTATNTNGSGENYRNWNVISTPPIMNSSASDFLIGTAESFSQRTFEIITDIASKIRVRVTGVITFVQESME